MHLISLQRQLSLSITYLGRSITLGSRQGFSCQDNISQLSVHASCLERKITQFDIILYDFAQKYPNYYILK